MDTILGGLGFDFTHEAAQEAAGKWLGEAQRPLLMMSRFHHDEKVRLVTRSLWLETRRCVDKMGSLLRIAEMNAERRADLSERRKQDWAEANFALDNLVELLGGPQAPPREAYAL